MGPSPGLVTMRAARFGFIGSSDGHKARPGTGYKERDRILIADGLKFRNENVRRQLLGQPRGERTAYQPLDMPEFNAGFGTFETERMASFLTSGGLAAVHAEARTRDAIWQAMERREVYATSGGRTLLWFDLLNAPAGTIGTRPDGTLPMGSELAMDHSPRFRVRAAGALRQAPGCPDYSTSALSPARLQRLCRGECYHPTEPRKRISRVEVVRIRTQREPGEAVGASIDDPWIRHECPPDPAGCVFEFGDPDYPAAGRTIAYYVRVFEEPSPAVNAGGFRCQYDADGRCVEMAPCYQDHRTPLDDDCLAEVEERAWSSPIWLDPARP